MVRINRERGVTILLVEQNAHMALKIADFGYVLEVGRIVMEDTGARLAEKDDIREFYLGMKAGGVRGDAAMETQETLALTAAQGGRRHRAEDVLARRRPTRAPRGDPAAEAIRHLAEHHLDASSARSRARSAWGWSRSASSRANAPRCSPTPTANGFTPTWAFSAPAACRTASIRPTRRRRSSISARIPRTVYLFVEDDEQLDKALEVRARLPKLRKIIVFDMDGLRDFDDRQVMSLDALRALGREYDAAHPGRVGAAPRRCASRPISRC